MNFVRYNIYFFKCEGEFLKHNLIWTFLHDISLIFMPSKTIPMLDWVACPAWLFSLSLSFFTMPGMNIPCEPQSPSLSENEACDMTVRQNSWAWSNFFHVSVAFISIDELVRYVFMPMQYQPLHSHKLEQLYSFELCEGMTKNFSCRNNKISRFILKF